jgi:hypothetical protein
MDCRWRLPTNSHVAIASGEEDTAGAEDGGYPVGAFDRDEFAAVGGVENPIRRDGPPRATSVWSEVMSAVKDGVDLGCRPRRAAEFDVPDDDAARFC